MPLHKAPTHTPTLGLMLDDLGRPHPKKIAKVLGVHERTVRSWIKADCAPRPVLLSLFWLTRWGFSHVDAELHNTAMVHMGHAKALESEVKALKHELARVLSLATFDTANAPTMVDVPRLEAPPAPRLQLVKA